MTIAFLTRRTASNADSARIAFDASPSDTSPRDAQVVMAREGEPGYQIYSDGWTTIEEANIEATRLNELYRRSDEDRSQIFTSCLAAGPVPAPATPDSQRSPQEIDTELDQVHTELGEIELRLARIATSLKTPARFRMPGMLTDLTEQQRSLTRRAATLEQRRSELEDEFTARGGWTRAFLVNNAGGHVHTTMACSTCHRGRQRTSFRWLTEYSGRTQDDIVADAGQRACTVCYPDAPVEVLRRPSVIRSDEEIAKARRAAEREAARVKKAAREITMPDGSPLRIDGYVVKNERTAQNRAVEVLADRLFYGIDETKPHVRAALACVADAITAMAHKRGTPIEEIEAVIVDKAATKFRNYAKDCDLL